MNVWTDPSFELGTAGLTTDGSAERSGPDVGYWTDGEYGLLLLAAAPTGIDPDGGYSKASRTVSTVAGQTYSLSAYIAIATAGSPQVPLTVEARETGGTVLATYSTSSGTASFALWEPGSFVATDTQIVVEWRTDVPVSGSGTWALDEVAVTGPDGEGVVAISKYSAHTALVAALKDINGSPYWTTLDNRVYTRLFTPIDAPDRAELPYVCCPLEQEQESFEFSHRTGEGRWSVRVYFFTTDNRDSDPYNSGSLEACAKFRDDLARLLMTDQTLDGEVKNCEVRTVNTFSGDEIVAYGELVADLSIYQVFGRTDLGPTA